MDLFTILADIIAACILTALILGVKVRYVQEARRRNSIKWRKRMFCQKEVYDLGPDEWTIEPAKAEGRLRCQE